ncbi:MAG: hypothetical protein Q4D13_06850 [Erysipelotrichaceae bacterium]|nr:hypothetical protein [Erysipelotrichaceae bacterium]
MEKKLLQELEDSIIAYSKNENEENFTRVVFTLSILMSCDDDYVYVPFRMDKKEEEDLYLLPTEEEGVYLYDENVNYDFYITDFEDMNFMAVTTSNHHEIDKNQFGYVALPLEVLLTFCMEEDDMGLIFLAGDEAFPVDYELIGVLIEHMMMLEDDFMTGMEVRLFDEYIDDKYHKCLCIDKPFKKKIKEVCDYLKSIKRQTFVSLLIPISVTENHEYMCELIEAILKVIDPKVLIDIYVRDFENMDEMDFIIDSVINEHKGE